jgi:hypothetical protein
MEDAFEVVLTAGPVSDVALVQSVLDGEGIPYVVQGEHHSAMEGIAPVRFLVPRDAAARAREALKEFIAPSE